MQERELELLVQASHAAGEVAASYFGNGPESWDKGAGQGPVTEADLAVDALLKDALLDACPEYGWLSEESEDGATRLTRERVFIVDPIDGTRAFIDGSPNFSHALAIVEDGIVTHGVVHMPIKGLTFAARRGGGATLNGETIEVGRRAELDGAQTLIARPMMEPHHWPGGPPPISRHFRSSLAYRLCLIANGRFDAMVTVRDAWEWDVAAGSLIVAEAGGAVSDRLNGALRFNNSHPKVPGVVATNPDLHGQFLSRLTG